MSGGFFDYKQSYIDYITDDIQNILDNMGKEKPSDEIRFFDSEYLDKYPEERYYPTYSADVIKIFTEAVNRLKIAKVYAQRIDWYLSGDDGEESLIERLKEDLENL